ncbi:unnamed protein product, partial [Prunus brigantina]
SRAVKRGVDSSSPIPLEVRLAEATKVGESFAWAKGSSATWLIKSVRLAILVLSQVFPWKNKRKQHFTSFKKEVVVEVADQARGAAESVADQANAEEFAYQGSPASVSK